ncbi:MAG: hypothetical protein PHY73_01215 [Candidatus Omnitrophica bacterium]|nr:hypothetical protein [Candidatus Omnitrophota bacterium]
MERNLGEQPIKEILDTHGLKSHDLVVASKGEITHKMVVRASKGRWLTPSTRKKVLKALNEACQEKFELIHLFNY